MTWERPLDEIPGWLDRQLKGMAIADLDILEAALAGRCGDPDECIGPLVVARVRINGVIANERRTEEPRIQQRQAEDSTRLAIIGLIASSVVGLLSIIVTAWVTLRSRNADATSVALADLARSLREAHLPEPRARRPRKRAEV